MVSTKTFAEDASWNMIACERSSSELTFADRGIREEKRIGKEKGVEE
jgi:hypothetical protein